MKYIIFSDIHGSKKVAKEIKEKIEQEEADFVLLLGDLLYHGPRNPLPEGYDPEGVIEVLNEYKEKIIAVAGNCEAYVDQMVLHFPVLSPYNQLVIDGRRVFMTHGHEYQPEDLKILKKGDVFLQGHTHIPMIEEKENCYHINPGSTTLPKGGSKRSYGIFQNGTFTIKGFDGLVIMEKVL